MQFEKGFETLKILEQNERTILGMDYTIGKLLIHRVQEKEDITKKQIFMWLEEIIVQLSLYYRYKKKPYKNVNPYCIVVGRDEKVSLLDLTAESNEEVFINIQKKAIREKFHCNYIDQNNSWECDAYGFGMTTQFLLSQFHTSIKLNKREIYQLKKLIRISTSNQSRFKIKSLNEIHRYIPKAKILKEKNKKKRNTNTNKIWAFFTCCLLLACVGIYFGMERKQNIPTEIVERIQPNNLSNMYDEEYKKLLFETGLVYFLEVENYKKSAEKFKTISEENELAEAYYMVAKYMAGEKQQSEESITDLLNTIYELSRKDGGDYLMHSIAVCRVYGLINSVESNEMLIRIIEENQRNIEWGGLKEQIKEEMQLYLGEAYYRLHEIERAIAVYSILSEEIQEEDQLRIIYCRLIELYIEQKDYVNGKKICEKGLENINESTEFVYKDIEILCLNKEIPREEVARNIEKYINENPTLQETEEFKNLANIFLIEVSEEKTVCLGV